MHLCALCDLEHYCVWLEKKTCERCNVRYLSFTMRCCRYGYLLFCLAGLQLFPLFDIFCPLCIIIDLDTTEERSFSPDSEQRRVWSAASVCPCFQTSADEIYWIWISPWVWMTPLLPRWIVILTHKKGYRLSIWSQHNPSIKPRQRHSEWECMSDVSKMGLMPAWFINLCIGISNIFQLCSPYKLANRRVHGITLLFLLKKEKRLLMRL